MRTIYISIALLLIVGIAFSQSPVSKKIVTPISLTSGGSWFTKVYTLSTADTSQSIVLGGYRNIALNLRSKDSCAVWVAYQPSIDGITFGTLITIDSLVTVSNTGDTRGFALPANGSFMQAIRWVLTFSGAKIGVSNDTLIAQCVLKQ